MKVCEACDIAHSFSKCPLCEEKEQTVRLDERVSELQNEVSHGIGTLYPAMGETDIHGKKAKNSVLHMTMEMGEVRDKDGKVFYDIDQIIGGGVRVYNRKNRRLVVFSLQEILNLALRREIDGDTPIENPADKKKGKEARK